MANVFGTLLKIDNNLTLRYKYGKNFTYIYLIFFINILLFTSFINKKHCYLTKSYNFNLIFDII